MGAIDCRSDSDQAAPSEGASALISDGQTCDIKHDEHPPPGIIPIVKLQTGLTPTNLQNRRTQINPAIPCSYLLHPAKTSSPDLLEVERFLTYSEF